MTFWQWLVVGCYIPVVLIAITRHFVYAFSMRHTPHLTPHDPQVADESGPLVSIIIPAKDEQDSIERCVRSLLSQDYQNFEILVVDDRSIDNTAAIVRSLQQESSKVQLVQIEQLPPGWTGKTHALDHCQRQARGEWLLFVDADTRQHPACLGVVLQDAIKHNADLESLLPALESQSFWERVIQPFAGVCLMVLYPMNRVNDPKNKHLGFANGQFILIRRKTYNTIGGHVAVRDKFVEDIHLGRNVRRGGHNLRVVMAPEISAVRMYASLQGIVRGWSRILYSAVDARPLPLYLLFLSITVFSLLSYVVLVVAGGLWITGTRTGFLETILVLGIVHQLAQTTLMARIYRASHSSLLYLLFRPIAVTVMLWILARTIRLCKTHAVTWRGTSYDQHLQQNR